MNERYRWTVTIGAALMLAGVVGMWSDDLGMSRALAENTRLAAAQPGPVPNVYVLQRPWGFGFGFPLFFMLLLWFVLLRVSLWRGPWRSGWYRYEGVPPMFDEWHRR